MEPEELTKMINSNEFQWIETLTASIIERSPYLRNFEKSSIFPAVYSDKSELQKMHLRLNTEVEMLAEEFGNILPILLAYDGKGDTDNIFELELKAMEFYLGLFQLRVLEGLIACGAEVYSGYK